MSLLQEIKVTAEEPEEEEEAAKAARKEEDLEAAFKKQLRATAKSDLASFDANASIAEGDKKFWMVTTVPEVPVAGEECILFFNRQQSESLRERPRVELHFGFNRCSRRHNANAMSPLLPFFNCPSLLSCPDLIPSPRLLA